MKDIPHYLDRFDIEDEYAGYGSDDGHDAIKDANAELGFGPYNHNGFRLAKQRGWIKKKSKDDS